MGRGRSISIEVGGGRQLAELTRALRRQADGKARAKKLRKELTAAAKPLVPAVRGKIRGLPSQGENARRGHPWLRREMARSVTLQVRTRGRRAGVSVFMNPRRMPTGKKGLPAYFEGIGKRRQLRHPVFGDTDTWVAQPVPPAGYFTTAARPVERRAFNAVERVLAFTAREIEDS